MRDGWRRTALTAALAIGCTVSEPRPAADAHRSEPARDPIVADDPAPAAPVRTPAEIRAQGNHLVGEPSPYLEQHAHNPVDWYPWGEAALARARRENKPIFLSIGYSTCHWCHVMEEESFEDDEVAAFINAHFVAIKVDRERRPDVDALYIDAVRALGGSTGWPLNVFLTPDLEPFFGGTYFPRHARAGRPGFLDVLGQVHDTWRTDGASAARKGREILQRVEQQALAAVGEPAGLGAQVIDDAMRTLAAARDDVEGGFGHRQKFPNAPLLLAALRHVARTGDTAVRDHLALTLDAMMRGGIRDHVGGGFHRYAVDARWHLPHFEKTLYDNAQLAALYVEAGRGLGREDWVAVGRAVLDELVATWEGPDGGFVVGFDADDPRGEGAYYTFTPAELRQALGEDDAAVIAAAFGVDEAGERELEGRSVLHRRPDDEVARALGIDADRVRAAIDRSRPRLLAVRAERPAPAVDDKALVGWNGLAIMALADAGRWLDEPRYVKAAETAAAFVTGCFVDGRMLRGRRGGTPLEDGVLEDYALPVLALVRLHAATGDARWLVEARSIADAMVERFHDPARHAFVHTAAHDGDLPVRLVDLDDGALPSGGAAAVLALLELGALTGDSAVYDVGHDVLSRMATSLPSRPFTAGAWLAAVDHATAPVREVVVAGDPGDATADALWHATLGTSHARILPARIPASGAASELVSSYPALRGKAARRGKATAYVCERGRCEAPTSDVATLRAQLAAALTR